MAKASCPRPTAPANGLLGRAIARAPGPPNAAPRNLSPNQQLGARPSRRASAFSALPATPWQHRITAARHRRNNRNIPPKQAWVNPRANENSKRFGACNDLLPSLPCRRGARRPRLFDRPGLALSDVRAEAELRWLLERSDRDREGQVRSRLPLSGQDRERGGRLRGQRLLHGFRQG